MLAIGYYVFIIAGIGMAALFQVLYLKTKIPLLLVCSFVWLLPICYEIWALNNCTGECNIRVDLVYLFPVEVIAAAILSLLSWRAYRKGARRT